MAKVILGATISLDGFAEDSNSSVGALYPDLDTLRNSEVLRESIHTTGSVVMAWKEFAMAEDPDSIADNYEYLVPIFVFTDRAPKKHPKETDRLTFTFVTDGIDTLFVFYMHCGSAVSSGRRIPKGRDGSVMDQFDHNVYSISIRGLCTCLSYRIIY